MKKPLLITLIILAIVVVRILFYGFVIRPNNENLSVDINKVTEETPIPITPEIQSLAKSTSRPNKIQSRKDEENFLKVSRNNKKQDYVEDEVIVKFKNEKLDIKSIFGKAQVFVFEKRFSLEKKDEIKTSNIQVYKTKKSTEETINELKLDSNVEYVEPNYRRHPTTISTNDTYKDVLWGLDNIGQTVEGFVGTNDADIDAPEAWNLSEGSNVIVAIIDNGVAYNHPDLLANMWNGSSCKDENGNPLDGCNHGYDFEDDDKIPLPDTSSHGTHIVGIIAAAKNNGKGIIGVAPQTKIMALKFDLTVATEIKAIDFAIQNGAKVINASFGSDSYSQSEYDAINRFKAAGGIFVAAAGNNSINNDSGVHFYPSDYDLDNIISVAATDQRDNLASFSNYGAISVDVGAPGTNILSTVPNETTVLNETFEGVMPPNIPSEWVKGGTNNNWGTYFLGGLWGKVLYGDLAYPYANNTNTTVISLKYDLSSSGANIDFWAACDTEYITNGWADYMQLEYSTDGVNFAPAIDPFSGEEFRWDEAYLDFLDDDSSPSGSAVYHFQNIRIPSQYISANFKFRFRWITNSSDNNYDGCLIDDVEIIQFSDGSDEKYDYKEGTSMAAPHVAGLAALIWSTKPSLTLSQVKNIILESGDSLTSLSGKTVSGKRINAYNALYFFLSQGSSVYRFWSNTYRGHFYTMSEDEKNYVIATWPGIWSYEGEAYEAFFIQAPGTLPVYRFWSSVFRGHFYTMSEDEKNYVIATWPGTWSYEGVAYYAMESGSVPVYRFWSNAYRHHFYTTSEDEKNYVIATWPDKWSYEGIAFYAAE